MRAIFKSCWVRRLIGKPGVPYNRKLQVQGSSHPLFYALIYHSPQRKATLSVATRPGPSGASATVRIFWYALIWVYRLRNKKYTTKTKRITKGIAPQI
jgi:hypothetical protein